MIERILFVFAKLNPGIGYIQVESIYSLFTSTDLFSCFDFQGMNEILGPIYYVMASDADSAWSASAEADAFYCFTIIMGDFRDNFIKTLDDSDVGIS